MSRVSRETPRASVVPRVQAQFTGQTRGDDCASVCRLRRGRHGATPLAVPARCVDFAQTLHRKRRRVDDRPCKSAHASGTVFMLGRHAPRGETVVLALLALSIAACGGSRNVGSTESAPAIASQCQAQMPTTPIAACMIITTPGAYVLTADVVGTAPYAPPSAPTTACIEIRDTSQVTLDCQGHELGGGVDGVVITNVSGTRSRTATSGPDHAPTGAPYPLTCSAGTPCQVFEVGAWRRRGGKDWHWLRLDKATRTWSEKRGGVGPDNMDANGNVIVNPVVAAVSWGYPENVGFFCTCGGFANIR